MERFRIWPSFLRTGFYVAYLSYVLHYCFGICVSVCMYDIIIDLLIPRVPLWLLQVGIEVTSHQKICPTGLLDDGSNNGLYGRGIFWV